MKVSDLIIMILLVAVIAMGFLLYNVNKKSLHNYAAYLRVADTAQYYEDKYGRSKAEIISLETELEVLKVAHKDMFDSLRSQFDLKIKDIESVITVGLKQSRVLEVPVYDTLIATDTITQTTGYAKSFDHQDRWLDINGALYGDYLNLNYTSYDSLSIVQQRLRGGIKTSILSHNPNTVLRGVTSFTVKKDKRLGVGAFAGPAATTKGLVPFAVGVGVLYRFW